MLEQFTSTYYARVFTRAIVSPFFVPAMKEKEITAFGIAFLWTIW